MAKTQSKPKSKVERNIKSAPKPARADPSPVDEMGAEDESAEDANRSKVKAVSPAMKRR